MRIMNFVREKPAGVFAIATLSCSVGQLNAHGTGDRGFIIPGQLGSFYLLYFLKINTIPI